MGFNRFTLILQSYTFFHVFANALGFKISKSSSAQHNLFLDILLKFLETFLTSAFKAFSLPSI